MKKFTLLVDQSGKHLTDDKEIVECLNRQYAGQLSLLSLPAFYSRSEKS